MKGYKLSVLCSKQVQDSWRINDDVLENIKYSLLYPLTYFFFLLIFSLLAYNLDA